MTPYNLLRQRCGLSQREAADFHGVTLRTIEHWCAGPDRQRRHDPPPGAVDELRALYARIELAAAASVEAIRAQKPDGVVELGLAKSDKEARSLGFPSVGAHAALLAIVAARLDVPVQIVPRGSTKATKAAAAAHAFIQRKL